MGKPPPVRILIDLSQHHTKCHSAISFISLSIGVSCKSECVSESQSMCVCVRECHGIIHHFGLDLFFWAKLPFSRRIFNFVHLSAASWRTHASATRYTDTQIERFEIHLHTFRRFRVIFRGSLTDKRHLPDKRPDGQSGKQSYV